MLDLIFNKYDSLFLEKKLVSTLGVPQEMTLNTDLQFMHKESGNSMTAAK